MFSNFSFLFCFLTQALSCHSAFLGPTITNHDISESVSFYYLKKKNFSPQVHDVNIHEYEKKPTHCEKTRLSLSFQSKIKHEIKISAHALYYFNVRSIRKH